MFSVIVWMLHVYMHAGRLWHSWDILLPSSGCKGWVLVLQCGLGRVGWGIVLSPVILTRLALMP